jgi:hypothetical protein
LKQEIDLGVQYVGLLVQPFSIKLWHAAQLIPLTARVVLVVSTLSTSGMHFFQRESSLLDCLANHSLAGGLRQNGRVAYLHLVYPNARHIA